MTYRYTYSAHVNKEVEQIRKKYMPKEESKLDEIKRLDNKVQFAGIAESLCLGVVGCLLFGIAMCMGLDVIGGGMILAVILGIVGIAVMLPAYPLYRRIAAKARTEYSARILQLADDIQNNL